MSRVVVSCQPAVKDKATRRSKMSRKSARRMITLCRQLSTSLGKEDIDSYKEELESLIDSESPDLNHPRNQGSLPLCEACRSGNEWAVEILLNNGANVDVCDKNKCTPVYIASSHGNVSILRTLLRRNADVNIKNMQGYLPLLSAVENNHMETAKMLVEVGADVNILRPNTFGISMSLMTFVLFAKSDVSFAEKILEAGVCPHSFEQALNFILLEYGDECRNFIKKLVYAGFNFYCDGWIRMAKNKMNADYAEVTKNERDMIEFLEYEFSNPPSLERLCRTTVRTALATSNVKCHLKLKVDKLPLPNEMKKYVLLYYV